MKITKAQLKQLIKEELDAGHVPEMYEDWNSYNIRKFLGGVASVRPKDLNSDPEAAEKIHQLEVAAAALADEFKGDMKKYSTLHAAAVSELGNYWADKWFPGHVGDEDLPPEAEKDVADDLRSIANRLGGMQGAPLKDIEAIYDRFNESKFNKRGGMMKISKNRLKRLIKEELAKVLMEIDANNDGDLDPDELRALAGRLEQGEALSDEAKQDISKKFESLLFSFYGRPDEEGLGLINYLRKGGKDEGHLKEATSISSDFARALRNALRPHAEQDHNMAKAFSAAEGLGEDLYDCPPECAHNFLDQKVGIIRSALKDAGIEVRTG